MSKKKKHGETDKKYLLFLLLLATFFLGGEREEGGGILSPLLGRFSVTTGTAAEVSFSLDSEAFLRGFSPPVSPLPSHICTAFFSLQHFKGRIS